ncbi:ATPase AAA [Verrucomicrobiota bacterium]|nr:ATPase AAA [Verrucomicrobiota bacterium]
MSLPAMSTEFVGRQRELAALEAAWKAEGGALWPVYGRRRVGKSELIVHFMRGKPGLYYVGKQAPGALQLREFLEAAAEALGEPLLATYPAADWSAAFRAVEERWRGPGKFVLALDEFQWLAGASPELPSIIQACWDRRWKSGKIMVILCGSYLGFMEREVLGKKSPLFGRRTGQMLLKPFGYAEAAEFHPRWSRVDQARAYFICGGLPFYLRCFSPALSVEQNLAAAMFDELGPLFREPEFLLREELREVANYHSILRALAAGQVTNAGLSGATGIGDRALQFYLSTLMELGYVQRRYPLTGAPPQARQVRYSLEDPLLRFWFRFVFPHTSQIALLGPQRAVQQLVRPQLDAFFGHAFERMCREALPFLYAQEGVSAACEVGEYWDKDTQIDVVGLRQDGWTDLGECKWGAVRSAAELRAELAARVGNFPNARQATLGQRFFTRAPVKVAESKGGNERWHSLDDLYEAAAV